MKAGPEQHQLLRLKQLKFLYCSSAWPYHSRQMLLMSPDWSRHAWSGPRLGPSAGGLHMWPVHSPLSQEAPTSWLDQTLVRVGGLVGVCGGFMAA